MPFNPNHAKAMEHAVNEWTKRIDQNAIVMCFSDESRRYFSPRNLSWYKANRGGIERPSALNFCFEYLTEKYKVVRKQA